VPLRRHRCAAGALWIRFLDEDRLVAFSLVALLACTTKEQIPLAVGCLGIW
jgi:hypothetical protein